MCGFKIICLQRIFLGVYWGGNAAYLNLPNDCIDKATLHCSIEHFEGYNDILLIKEMERILKNKGKLMIIPLYLAENPFIQTDSKSVSLRELDICEAGSVHNVRGWGNRHARFYSPKTFYNRIVKTLNNLDLKIYYFDKNKIPEFRNEQMYLKFFVVFEKKKDFKRKAKYNYYSENN